MYFKSDILFSERFYKLGIVYRKISLLLQNSFKVYFADSLQFLFNTI